MTETVAGHTIRIEPAGARVTVAVDGVKVGESAAAVVLYETGLPPRYYLPAADVDGAVLRPSELHTTCPFKGRASYHSIEIDGTTHRDVVWYYPDPIPEVAQIAGMMSFYPDRAEILVDGRPAG
jgi:uncharacterized protein (DUF427 family)